MRRLKTVREEVGLNDVVRIKSPRFEIFTVDPCTHRRVLDAVRLETKPHMTFFQKPARSASDFNDSQRSRLEMATEAEAKEMFGGVTASNMTQPSTERCGGRRQRNGRWFAVHGVPVRLVSKLVHYFRFSGPFPSKEAMQVA